MRSYYGWSKSIKRWSIIKRWSFNVVTGFALFAGSGVVQWGIWSPGERIVFGWPFPYLTMGWAGRGGQCSMAALWLDLIAWVACAPAVLWLVRRLT
jgi:hypothetical protein